VRMAPEEIKACCAAAYAAPAARFLLGDSFHPGGAALTSRLGRALAVGPGRLVVDVASGPGTSALQLARETGCSVVGVDLAPESVAAAGRAAEEAGAADRVRFLCGDAEALPLPDAGADGVLCECALCTFPDKRAAVSELARVLRPGGRLALADVVADPPRLPAALTTLQAWIACVADARPLEEIAGLLRDEGFAVEVAERRDEALAATLDRVEARLGLAAMLGAVAPDALARGGELVAAAAGALASGALGYGVVIARRA